MTGGVPVVWLTRQTSNVLMDAEEAVFLKAHGSPECRIGDIMFGGTAADGVPFPS